MDETFNTFEPYKVLHVHRRAPLSLIVEAYRHLAHQALHDTHSSHEREAILKELNRAYHILADAEQREAIAFGVPSQQASAGTPARMRLGEARRVLTGPCLGAAYDASSGLSGSADAAASAHDTEIREEFLRQFGKPSSPDAILVAPPVDDPPYTLDAEPPNGDGPALVRRQEAPESSPQPAGDVLSAVRWHAPRPRHPVKRAATGQRLFLLVLIVTVGAFIIGGKLRSIAGPVRRRGRRRPAQARRQEGRG